MLGDEGKPHDVQGLSNKSSSLIVPILRLPTELIDMVFDDLVALCHLPGDRLRNLRSCSLVCSVFLPHARARLFWFVRLPCLHDFARSPGLETSRWIKRIQALSHEFPDLYQLASGLMFVVDHPGACPGGSLPEGKDILTCHSDVGELLLPLQRVNYLELLGLCPMYISDRPEVVNLLQPIFSQVTVLYLDEWQPGPTPLDMFTLRSFLLRFPQLRSLKIDNSFILDGSDPDLPLLKLSSLDVSLADHMPDRADGYLIPRLCGSIVPRALRSVSVYLPDRQEPMWMTQTYIQHIMGELSSNFYNDSSAGYTVIEGVRAHQSSVKYMSFKLGTQLQSLGAAISVCPHIVLLPLPTIDLDLDLRRSRTANYFSAPMDEVLSVFSTLLATPAPFHRHFRINILTNYQVLFNDENRLPKPSVTSTSLRKQPLGPQKPIISETYELKSILGIAHHESPAVVRLHLEYEDYGYRSHQARRQGISLSSFVFEVGPTAASETNG
jgi:hypothetical protein